MFKKALCTVPQVSEGMNLLKQQVPEGLYDLVEYFDTTFVHGPLKAIPGARGLIRMQRINSPRFAIDKWNVNAVSWKMVTERTMFVSRGTMPFIN